MDNNGRAQLQFYEILWITIATNVELQLFYSETNGTESNYVYRVRYKQIKLSWILWQSIYFGLNVKIKPVRTAMFVKRVQSKAAKM
jgi:hypothetical protein